MCRSYSRCCIYVPGDTPTLKWLVGGGPLVLALAALWHVGIGIMMGGWTPATGWLRVLPSPMSMSRTNHCIMPGPPTSTMGELGCDWSGVREAASRDADRARLATVDAWKPPGEVRFAGEERSPNLRRVEAAAAAPDINRRNDRFKTAPKTFSSAYVLPQTW